MVQKKRITSEQILVKNEELENYFANTIIPQLFVDANLILRKFTPPAMTHFDLSVKDIGKNINLVKDNIRYPTVVENIQEVISTGEMLEKEIQTVDGKWYQMNILPYKVQKENRTNGVIMTFVEVTQRINALRQLEELNAEHETLLFALSHDIGQPLTLLTLMGDVLKKTFEHQDKEKFYTNLERLNSSVRNVKILVDGFIAESDSGPEWEKKIERIDIQSVVNDITTGLKSKNFSTQNFDCDFEHSEILFSRNNLRSILYNLLNNAIKFRNPDEKLKVHISTMKSGDYVLLQIKDNGLGIDPEKLDQIFEKGQRLNPTIEGTGMGLYIIKRMLNSMGSTIKVESEPGEGSTFSVYFKEKPS